VTTARHRRIREINIRLVHAYLTDKRCEFCGFSDIRALQFDHVRGVKRNSVSALANIGASWASILIEIAKCRVLCANCHAIRTAEQFNYRKHQLLMSGST
jgi:hypothetical protein